MKISFFLIILVAIVVFSIYAIINWQKTGSFFGSSTYKEVGLVNLLSFANFYSDKSICTNGYYVELDSISVLKVSLDEDQYTRSLWIENPINRPIIFQPYISGGKSVEVKVCGKFESRRAGEWGDPPVWNHLLTVEEFETLGEYSRYAP